MKNKIITEINRHRELMGLDTINESQENKILLTEGTYKNGELPDGELKDVTNPDGSNIKLSVIAVNPYKKMVETYNQETGGNMNSSQGYRDCGSPERGCKDGFTQWCAWYKWNKNPKYAADPRNGCKSNHGLGCAVDVKNCKDGSKIHNWLKANASRFGFKPYSRESWHWEHGECISSMKSGNATESDEEIETEIIPQTELEVGAEGETTNQSANNTSNTDGDKFVDDTSPWDVEGGFKKRIDKIGDNITKAIKTLGSIT
jgi:hypothetical protein